MLYPILIRDALNNLAPRSGSSPEYNRGIIVGIVAALMADGSTFYTAIQKIIQNLPKQYDREAIPAAWRENFPLNDDEPIGRV